MSGRLRLADMLAGLSIAADLGFGLPPEEAMRSCLIATALAREHGLSQDQVADSFYAGLLMHLGCSALSHETVAAFGDDSKVAIDVPARRSPYALDLAPLHPDPVGVHRHTNGFWRDAPDGRPARLQLEIPRAEDVTCIQLVGVCGSIAAPASSPVAGLLGSRRRAADLVFDHVGLKASTLAFGAAAGAGSVQ